MKQAQQMQEKATRVQEELSEREFESSVGGGKVTVIANGAGEIKDLKIDPSIVDPEDVEFLQELVLKGVQDAITQGKGAVADEMGKLTGGMNLPGMF